MRTKILRICLFSVKLQEKHDTLVHATFPPLESERVCFKRVEDYIRLQKFRLLSEINYCYFFVTVVDYLFYKLEIVQFDWMFDRKSTTGLYEVALYTIDASE